MTKKIVINVKPRRFTDAELNDLVVRGGELWLKLEVLQGLPTGLSDNDPKLLAAFNTKFKGLLKEYQARSAGLTGSSLYLVNELDKGVTVPEIETIRLDCIEHYLYRTVEAEKVYSINKLSTPKRLLLRQFKAFLEHKKDIRNEYIIPYDLIKELFDYNAKNECWDVETFEDWSQRFSISIKKHKKLEPKDKDKFHLMVNLVATLAQQNGKIKNRLNEIAKPRFGYSHYSRNREKYREYDQPPAQNLISDVHFTQIYFKYSGNA
ncbi:MAG: hypothetical protein PHD06_05190 [Bacteroidales bacterium]|nr:hypothetical protein [Bacteroidales bacterium]